MQGMLGWFQLPRPVAFKFSKGFSTTNSHSQGFICGLWWFWHGISNKRNPDRGQCLHTHSPRTDYYKNKFELRSPHKLHETIPWKVNNQKIWRMNNGWVGCVAPHHPRTAEFHRAFGPDRCQAQWGRTFTTRPFSACRAKSLSEDKHNGSNYISPNCT